MNGSRCRSILVTVEVTVKAAAGSLTVTVSGVTAAGTAFSLLVGTAISAIGVYTYLVSPLTTTSATAIEGVTEVANLEVPALYKVSVAVGNADSWTYSATVDEI